MKRIIACFLTFCLMSLNILPALAEVTIRDVDSNYWAQKEILNVVNGRIMTVDENGMFNPEKGVTRVEFVQALLQLLSNKNLNVNIQNSFTDVSETYPAYADILRSEQLGLVYGYPDKTFRPEQMLLRSETTSIMSHITQENIMDVSVLNQFEDKSTIPAWAIPSYAKAVQYGLYVNHPYAQLLEPNRNITRAEAAVLLSILKDKISLVKKQYKGPEEKLLAVEHLNVHKKSPNNTVNITNMRKVICENNVLLIEFDSKYFSKKSCAGDIVNFVIDQDLYTEEGTLVLPACTKLVAQVINIQNPKWFNKHARVDLQFKNVVMPDGRVFPICAKPFTKDGKLKEGPWMTAGNLALCTLTFGVLGAGAGVGFAFIPTPAKIGAGLAIGIPVGCAVGLATGLITPGLHYKAKQGEQIFIILTDDASIYN